MSPAIRVGGDIDAACSKCKMVLGHTVLAMVGTQAKRVRCNTCQGEHSYRSSAPVKSKTPRATRAKPVVTSWEALLAGKDLTRARRYSMKERFVTNELVQHPTFGVGLVQSVNVDKITVAFKADVKVLIMGKSP